MRAMVMQFAAIVGNIVMILVFPFQPPNPQQASEEELRLLFKAIDNRQKQYNPIWVCFRLDITESAKYLEQLKPGYKDGDRQSKYSCQYARKGTRIRSSVKGEGGTMTRWLTEEFYIYTGEISISPTNEKDVFKISRNAKPAVLIEQPPHLLTEQQLHQDLDLWAQGRLSLYRIKILEEKAVDGEPMILLTWTYPKTNWKCTCLTVPVQDWTVRSYQDHFPSDKIGTALEVKEYLTSAGLYYPRIGSRTDYFEDGSIQKKVSFQVDQLETQDSKIPDHLFQFDFPKGSQIWDEDLKVMVRDTELTESHLAELVRHAASSRRLVTQWLAVAICLLNVVLFTLVLLRWIGRTQRKVSA